MNERQLKTLKDTGKLAGKSLAIAILSVIAVLFLAQKIENKTKEIVMERNDFAVFSKRQEVFGQLKTDNEQVEEKIKKLESLLPTWDSAIVIIDHLNSLAAKTQNIASVRIDSAPTFNQESQMGSAGLSIELTGSLATLLELLRELEKSPYAMNISELSASFADGQNNRMTAKMTGVVYLRKD